MIVAAISPSASVARTGLTSQPKTLPPWLFYDERGSHLFEQITYLPEYYLTRTEHHLLERYAEEILQTVTSPVTVVELGAGTATKTGILLQAATRLQERILYQPIDISPSALEEASENICARIPGVTVRTQVANYVTDPVVLHRPAHHRILVLYIGSSIGNFSPEDARSILGNLRLQMQPGDSLLLGTDLAPGTGKSVDALVAAYDDSQGITAAFNLNILGRLNRELGANFDLSCFTHRAIWNSGESRIEMHLVSSCEQTVELPANSAGSALKLRFLSGETIHTENSYKFTPETISDLLTPSGFVTSRTFTDTDGLFALTLADAV